MEPFSDISLLLFIEFTFLSGKHQFSNYFTAEPSLSASGKKEKPQRSLENVSLEWKRWFKPLRRTKKGDKNFYIDFLQFYILTPKSRLTSFEYQKVHLIDALPRRYASTFVIAF